MTHKHLDGTGKGEMQYDFKHDILMFKVRDRDYQMSTEFQNFVADIDEEGFVTGIRVFDASTVFNIEKEILKNIRQWEFKAIIEDNTLTVTFRFAGKRENTEIPIENFTQQMTTSLNGYHLADSSVECAIA